MTSLQCHNSYASSSCSPDIIDRFDNNSIEFSLHNTITEKLCNISLRNWNYFTLFLNLSGMLFSISSLITPRWVEQGDTSNFWRGSVLKCGECMGLWKNENYDYIEKLSCGKMEGYCETFHRLYLAGIIIILVQTVFLILCSISAIVIIFSLLERFSDKKIIYIMMISTPLIQIIGLVTWLVISKAQINGNCYKNSTTVQESFSVCATHGPILIIISIFLTTVSAISYFLIRSANKKYINSKIAPYVDA